MADLQDGGCDCDVQSLSQWRRGTEGRGTGGQFSLP